MLQIYHLLRLLMVTDVFVDFIFSWSLLYRIFHWDFRIFFFSPGSWEEPQFVSGHVESIETFMMSSVWLHCWKLWFLSMMLFRCWKVWFLSMMLPSWPQLWAEVPTVYWLRCRASTLRLAATPHTISDYDHPLHSEHRCHARISLDLSILSNLELSGPGNGEVCSLHL